MVCSGHLVRSHDWSFDRPRNRKWVCSRGRSWCYIRSSLFH
uniref:NEP1-interacting protein 1-like isoform X2 n=1 Tax=Rhizophora mucronata TaxID=61149 RepID=A0A2P2KQD3_RHIMU